MTIENKTHGAIIAAIRMEMNINQQSQHKFGFASPGKLFQVFRIILQRFQYLAMPEIGDFLIDLFDDRLVMQLHKSDNGIPAPFINGSAQVF